MLSRSYDSFIELNTSSSEWQADGLFLCTHEGLRLVGTVQVSIDINRFEAYTGARYQRPAVDDLWTSSFKTRGGRGVTVVVRVFLGCENGRTAEFPRDD
ncbi:hypothetical protein ARMGADRAFT_62441 [Armillaria gallica]|uniref:Uncharacterized protein n=1 Tax=Armillaria gallica TaxID=47427 RepID=A0A2H3DHI4_ARMGA|nr:hypothetical protein ARMGADRAFT_62441 [Armillaria gallica]